jgi:hypothetical protein
MPLWSWAVVIVLLTTVAILVVSALGGHRAVVASLFGEASLRPCTDGGLRSRNPVGESGCPSSWPVIYILAGIGAFGFVVLYRWTIGWHRARRWPGR